MNSKQIYSVFWFVLGVGAGFFLDHLSLIKVTYDMEIMDIANVLAVFAVAIMIPLSISRWIDNNKNIKRFLIEKFVSYSGSLNCLQENLENSLGSEIDPAKIHLLLGGIQRHLELVLKQLERSFDADTRMLRRDLLNAFLLYHKRITEDELFQTGYEVSRTFCQLAGRETLNLQIEVESAVHRINTL